MKGGYSFFQAQNSTVTKRSAWCVLLHQYETEQQQLQEQKKNWFIPAKATIKTALKIPTKLSVNAPCIFVGI